MIPQPFTVLPTFLLAVVAAGMLVLAAIEPVVIAIAPVVIALVVAVVTPVPEEVDAGAPMGVVVKYRLTSVAVPKTSVPPVLVPTLTVALAVQLPRKSSRA